MIKPLRGRNNFDSAPFKQDDMRVGAKD